MPVIHRIYLAQIKTINGAMQHGVSIQLKDGREYFAMQITFDLKIPHAPAIVGTFKQNL